MIDARSDTVPATAETNSTSNATRLLCAGAYLDDTYRRAVIHELFVEQYRHIAPSYGYDVVPVLGHALAARRLRLLQSALVLAALLLFFLLMISGLIDFPLAFVLFAWACWCSAFLLRVVAVETLVRRLKPARRGRGFDGGYPRNDRLLDERVAELREQQNASREVIYYGGFEPFVGAGVSLGSWSNAELLVEAPPNPLLPDDPPAAATAAAARAGTGEGVIPFTVADITNYVAEHLRRDLCEHPEPGDPIENLVIERRKYAKAVADTASERIDLTRRSSRIHWEETHDAAREYLCVRIGSWEQELVTSMFVGFDLKGNTLHTEFYPYVLPPISAAFHLVDQLPDQLTPRLLGRIAWDSARGLIGETLRALTCPLAERLPNAANVTEAIDKQLAKTVGPASSSLGVARYARHRIDRGARYSVRELATPNRMQHFFQRADRDKYKQIVERSLLRTIELFLEEHNVDLTDHRAAQANILSQKFGDVHNYAPNAVTSQGNRGRQFLRQATGRSTSSDDRH
jgi:hypothetical protein